MARTYTVHGHFKRRDGRQEALWTRTGLSKSEAGKLAREQRAESGGVAKIVPEEGPAYKKTAPSHVRHATKKSPTQLDKEIAEALAKKHPLTLGSGGLWRHRARETREQIAAERAGKRAATVGKRSHATMKPATTAAESKAYTEQLDRVIAPNLGKSRAQIVRSINSIVRAADGRNVYLIRERLGENTVRRITRARTKGRGMEVYLLDSGRWIGVMPELGDRIDVR